MEKPALTVVVEQLVPVTEMNLFGDFEHTTL
jgi:hypothetical protein